jgi:hypothetical protein
MLTWKNFLQPASCAFSVFDVMIGLRVPVNEVETLVNKQISASLHPHIGPHGYGCL